MKTTKTPIVSTYPLSLRIPTPLRAAIKKESEKKDRSMTDLAVEALRDRFLTKVTVK